jgi:hypothetical protein
VNDCFGLSEGKDQPHAKFGGFFGWSTDRGVERAHNQQFTALKLGLPTQPAIEMDRVRAQGK